MSILQEYHKGISAETQKNWIINGNFDYNLEGDQSPAAVTLFSYGKGKTNGDNKNN